MSKKLDPYDVGDINTHIDHMVKDAMRPIEPPVIMPVDRLDVPTIIRKDERVNTAQINGVLNLAQSRNMLPTHIKVVDINGSYAIRVEFGKEVKLVTKSPTGYHIENPVDLEILGGINNAVSIHKSMHQ